LKSLVDKWLATVAKSDNTKRNYSHAIKAFCEFVDKDPDQLIIEAEKEIKEGLLMRERSVSDYVPDFIEHLENKNLAPNTIRGYIMPIQSFYNYYDIQFPKQRNLESIVLESNIEIPSKSDIQTILKVCDPLEKAIILVGVSSGLSSNEIINLKVGTFKNGYDSTTGITTLKIRRGKTRTDFITFLTSEASQAVNDYLEFRDRKSDSTDIRKQRQLQKQHVYSDIDYLFIGRTIPNEWLEKRDERLRKLERNSFLKLYRMLNEKARKSTPKGTWNVIRSHNLRKYFNSTLLNAGCDSFFVEYTMGHKIDRTKASYFRSDPNSLAKIYEKFVPFITIQKELDISESEDFKRMKAEHATLLAEAEKHRIERKELQELRAELEAEKEANEAWKSEMHQELLSAVKINEQKKAAYSSEPFTDEQLSVLEKIEQENPQTIVQLSKGENLLKGLDKKSLDELPEEVSDIIERILKPDNKAKKLP
jgi:integrase